MKHFTSTLSKLTLLSALALQAHASQKLATYQDFDSSKVSPHAWVIFDIDNTLIHSQGMIGSVEWAEYMKERYLQAGFPPEEASKKQNELFAMTQQKAPNVIDYSVFPLLKKLPSSANVFALTARAPSLSMMTLEQLMSTSFVGTFEARFPQLRTKPQDLVIDRGVVFANGKDKGEILELLLKNASQEPDEIIFFDDKDYNVTAFDQAMVRINLSRVHQIRSQSFLFTGANSEIQKFDPKKADILWYQLRYLRAEDHMEEKQLLRHPELVAEALFYQEAPSLASSLWEVSCHATGQIGSTIQTECDYTDCLEWKVTSEDEQQCERKSQPQKIGFELKYLPELGIYIRPNWEFLE
jgi:hypothetical protein